MIWSLLSKNIDDDYVIYNLYSEKEQKEIELKRKILESSNNEKYYEVLNIKSPDLDFLHFPKTAYEIIVDGKADFIYGTSFPKMSIKLYKYIDENVGKAVRENTLKLFKNIKFGYTIIAKFDNGDRAFVSKDFIIDRYISRKSEIVKFENEKEAIEKADDLNDKYNYEILKNQCYINNYQDLSKLVGREKFLALNVQYGIFNSTNKSKYKQIYFVEECIL